MNAARRMLGPTGLPVVVALVALVAACGGNTPTTPPAPTPAPTPSPSANPCATAAAESPDELTAAVAEGDPPATGGKGRFGPRPPVDDDPRGNVLDLLWHHRATRTLGLLQPLEGPGRDAEDIGEIAVIQDNGDLILPANPLDLQTRGVRFTRNADGGYDAASTDAAFRAVLGSRLSLQDDDTTAIDLPFTFPFFGQGQSRVFLNSDGNLTFEESDTASTERSVSRFLTGAPRIAPFFADLDPSVSPGRLHAHVVPEALTVTWCGVRGFEKTDAVTVQAVLFPDGAVEFRYEQATLTDAVVGLSPGRTGNFRPVDLSASTAISGGATALGERFAAERDIDLVATARRFYQSHGDLFDQLIVWTDQRATSGTTFAFETTVANEIRGVGVDTFDASRDFGSGGRLRSVVMMDAVTKYPSDPLQKFLGENTTVSLLGQEVGHRWLAFLRFRDTGGQRSSALLGRADAHWSFFFDSDASVMEGNDIEDLGGGQFRTVDAVSRFSRLDQYAMGLVGEADVPAFFFVESPVNVQPRRDREDDPEIGVTFTGTRRTVLIQDVVTAMGARQPSVRDSPKVHRQAFIYVVSQGRTLDRGHVDRIDRARREWETFYQRAVEGRGRADTRLR